MTRETAKNEIKKLLTNYVNMITEKRSGDAYVCPLCKSGTHKKGTAAFHIKDGVFWKCFSCGENGDIFDLIGKIENISDFKDIMDRAIEMFGFTLDDNDHLSYKAEKASAHKPSNGNETSKAQETLVNYTEKFLQAQECLFDNTHGEGLEYLVKRGISAETAKKYGIGFIPAWRHPKVSQYVPQSPRIIVPLSKDSYFARDIRSGISSKTKQYEKQRVKGEKRHFFNESALYTSDSPIYVTEGEFSALSIIEAGGTAIALGSTSYADDFIKCVTEKPPVQPLIITMDNDDAGKKAVSKLSNGLVSLSVPFAVYNPMGDYKRSE
ncbi:MAG: hypothetical protein HDT43_01835 [Ruminococcaceae bacterium]|nr:hypothetical protein [Oscillospiraceae bacterium]